MELPGTVPALALQALHKKFGDTSILRGVDLVVQRGERVALIGPNGAGKSTLFNLIAGQSRPSSGEIRLNGQRIDGKPAFEINRLGLARSFQVSSLFGGLSVFDNLRCAMFWALGCRYTFLKLAGRLPGANQRVEELLASIRLDHKRHVLAADLGHAEQRALEIGITIATGANVVLLDEPTAGMGSSETSHFLQLIKTLTMDRTLLVVEHDMGAVFELADRIAVLVDGRILACGTPDAIRADRLVQQAYLGTGAGAIEVKGRD